MAIPRKNGLLIVRPRDIGLGHVYALAIKRLLLKSRVRKIGLYRNHQFDLRRTSVFTLDRLRDNYALLICSMDAFNYLLLCSFFHCSLSPWNAFYLDFRYFVKNGTLFGQNLPYLHIEDKESSITSRKNTQQK